MRLTRTYCTTGSVLKNGKNRNCGQNTAARRCKRSVVCAHVTLRPLAPSGSAEKHRVFQRCFNGVFALEALPLVFAAALIGFAHLAVKKEEPELGARFEGFLKTAYALVLKMVHFIIKFTPYGVLAIITVRVASGSVQFIIQLGLVIAASFVAMLGIFMLHLVIAAAGGISPLMYLKKLLPRCSLLLVPEAARQQCRLRCDQPP